ncbi:glycerol-3-phosphate 1-O-acyltransferase PlsY [Thermotoga sp. KOL6]|uniref:glycerol-3-phosphate 1-O-acyltransferase PlsY n=1 Tax=Thermotoga sp. KOL6 TaxID=126741 RepID=UPI000C768AF1|nr:glycerol-3-phosphate 1-O-acyltransferase PlsY [Thermotoga sp. KOL6]PLV60177.1 acyl-phosphate glycerol 3-phosphate acyltransferase [Thermotoga sp. KOL6]
MEWWLFPLIGYLVGSIPFSYLIPKWLKGIDIRKIGSGNVGATNAIRTTGPAIGGLCLLLDALKGFFPVFLTGIVSEDPKIISLTAIFTVLGHDFPVFMRFKGGKGVASTLGIIFYLAWPVGLVFTSVWILIVSFTRYASLGSLVGLYISALLGFFFRGYDTGMLILILAVLSTLRHSENIRRLLNGTERKVSLFKR